MCVNKEQMHSHQSIQEQDHETNPILDTDGVTKIVESLNTMNRTHVMDVQYLKELESRILDKHETITFPSLVNQTKESHRHPVIVTVTKLDYFFSFYTTILSCNLLLSCLSNW